MVKLSPGATLDDNRSPQWVKWSNWIDRWLQHLGISFVQLSEDALIAAAQKKAQLFDWGGDSFRIGLKVLLASINEEANLSLTGRLLLRRYITDLLVNRLQIQATLKQYPEILAVPISRPLIITGLPRTGTTFLHRLLAQDSQFRYLRLWELLQPCPPPDLANADTDDRIKKTQAFAQKYEKVAPPFATAHLIGAQLPEEGNHLLEHAFTNFLFSLRAHAPTYEAWLRDQDMRSPYQYYRQQLQLLSWRSPGRWLLKAPFHLRNLEALVSVFPDACIVQTHRDPCTVVPSICSLVAIFRNIFTEAPDLDVVGQDALGIVAHAHASGRQFRVRNPAIKICDVNYADLVGDPLSVVNGIYSFWGEQLHPEAADKMQRWLIENPQHKHGVHRYSLEQFGLSEVDVQERFV